MDSGEEHVLLEIYEPLHDRLQFLFLRNKKKVLVVIELIAFPYYHIVFHLSVSQPLGKGAAIHRKHSIDLRIRIVRNYLRIQSVPLDFLIFLSQSWESIILRQRDGLPGVGCL